jgi:phosphohistidine phosphatase SixA
MSTLYLIRHAHAGHRGSWSGDDQERPLSEKGFRQAKNLAKVLEGCGIRRLLSSPATRCIQTLESVGARLELPVEPCRELRESADPTKLIAVMEALASEQPAFCGHGDVIPEVIDLLVRRGMEIDGPAGNNKGSWWAIEHDGERFTLARWHPPM